MKIYRWSIFLFLFINLFLTVDPSFAQPTKDEKSRGDLVSLREEKIKIILDDETLEEVKVYQIDGVDYLSLSNLRRIYNAKSHWYPVSGKVVLNLNGKRVEFFLESKTVLVNQIQRKMSQPTQLINDEIYIPIQFLTTSSWKKISQGHTFWDSVSKTLTFTEKTIPVESAELQPGTTGLISLVPSTTESLMVSTTPWQMEKIAKFVEGKGLVRIIIDPGHGGKDPGAISRRGLKEKEINLSIAKELAKILNDEYGYQVLLTREDDIFLSIYTRAEIANQAQADLFVSIHCNASVSRRLNGFEIYFLSEKATDPEAQAVALRENAVIALEDISPWQRKEIEKILLSMETNVFLNQSSELAGVVSQRVSQGMDFNNSRVKQASFTVLRGVRMPAILVECGYLSNLTEEKKLRSRNFCKQLASGLAEGVHTYLQKNNNLKKASSQ